MSDLNALLLEAVMNSDFKRAKELLEMGADATARYASHQSSMLYVAVFRDHADMSKLLLDHGAEVNACNANGYTPLHWAARRSCSLVVRLLLERGADMNILNEDGETPLDIAQTNGHEGILAEFKNFSANKEKIQKIEMTENIDSCSFSDRLRLVDKLCRRRRKI